MFYLTVLYLFGMELNSEEIFLFVHFRFAIKILKMDDLPLRSDKRDKERMQERILVIFTIENLPKATINDI